MPCIRHATWHCGYALYWDAGRHLALTQKEIFVIWSSNLEVIAILVKGLKFHAFDKYQEIRPDL